MEWYVKIHRGCWMDRGTEEVHKIEIVLMTQQSFYSPSDSSPQPVVVATATQSFS